MHNNPIHVWMIVVCLLVVGGVLIWVENPLVARHSEAEQLKWSAGLLLICLVLVFLQALASWAVRSLGISEFLAQRRLTPGPAAAPPEKPRLRSDVAGVDRLQMYLRDHYSVVNRFRLRLLLVVGETEQIEAIAPGLANHGWLEAHGCILVWGGSTQQGVGSAIVISLQKLRLLRPVDGIVWALNEAQRDDAAAMSSGACHLQAFMRALRWQAPLYLWQVCHSPWPQTRRPSETVGCLLRPKAGLPAIEAALQGLITPLREQGAVQFQAHLGHDFLWRLSSSLNKVGIAAWCRALAPVLSEMAHGTPLRGVLFSLPYGAVPLAGMPQRLHADPAWLGVLNDRQASGRAMGRHPLRWAYLAGMAAALTLTAGLLITYVSNRVQIAEIPMAALNRGVDTAARLQALHQLAHQLQRLADQQETGAVWRRRLGLNVNPQLREKLWPLYVEINNSLIRDAARTSLEARLHALLASPPGAVAEAAQQAYAPLKAYLMLATPSKVESAFLASTLMSFVPANEDVPNALWQTLAPDLWRFYAEQLHSHPEWAIQPDPKLIAQARRLMLGHLSQGDGEGAAYLEVLEEARSQYPDLELAQLTGDTDVQALFSTRKTVPGIYTRQAWEGHIRLAIDHIAQGRREQIDWVLGDQLATTDIALSPETLKARLTERYFEDFSGAWLTFLNSLRWRQTADLPNIIDQLTLMSEVRQSPLIALFKTVAWQAQAGAQGRALADSLLQSAPQVVKTNGPAIEQNLPSLPGPLDETFGPLLQLLDRSPDAHNLQAFLTRVTRVRLKLQQVSNAPDPQAMTQALAQSVFQGKSIDLTDTRDYGSLIAAGLGAQWNGLGQSLFVQPLTQAWQGVLQPSAASLNRQWQRNIVAHWNSAFSGRYPFANSTSDASLPMLGQMIRSGTGRIDQFLASQLGGVLRKEGNRWVADYSHSQGLKFHPEFLTAMNQLSHLADVLYTDGNLGLHFDLQAKAVRDVVQTTLVLNGQSMEYYNQRESWQRFPWPGRSDYPGMHLTWTSVKAGARLFGSYDGPWGLIRWLEQAQVTPLDDSDTRFELVLTAPDGLGLTWFMRTDLGRGPLTLLQLRGFTLPSQIFMTPMASTRRGPARGDS